MSNYVLATAYVGNMKIFGWIAILLGKIMNVLYKGLNVIGIDNIGVSIILLTFIIYTLMLPLTYKQQKFSRLSQKMQPELKALQKKYKDKRDQTSQQKMMEEQRQIYDKYGVSPSGSCAQSFLSILILFPLYRVIYNVPAYVTRVKETLMPAVDGIMGTDNYKSIFDSVVENFNISLRNIGVSSPTISDISQDGDIQNRIVDVLYKLSPANWDSLASSFPSVDFVSVQDNFNSINNFCLLNITNAPQNIIVSSFKSGSFLVMILAIIVPILAGAVQLLNFKLMPQAGSTDPNDPMARQMRTMNYTMPLFSVFLAFTLPVGLGLYWIAGGIVRSFYQFILNKHFDKMNIDDIIEANKGKAEEKKKKRAENAERMMQAANMNTRTMKNSSISEEEREALLSKANEYKSKAKAGSMTARANMVKEFNEKNSK